MEITRINNYSFEKPLASDNSGFSKWGIGARGGKAFFVKEFLSPVYPAEDSVFTEKKKQERIRLCQSFVEEKTNLYTALREVSDGHIVTVEQFFRVGAKFYISVVDGERCICFDCGNKFDVEISGTNKTGKNNLAKLYLWYDARICVKYIFDVPYRNIRARVNELQQLVDKIISEGPIDESVLHSIH
jgi:hypothetical protein